MNAVGTKVHNMAQAMCGEPKGKKRSSKKASPKAKADTVKEGDS